MLILEQFIKFHYSFITRIGTLLPDNDKNQREIRDIQHFMKIFSIVSGYVAIALVFTGCVLYFTER